MRRHPSLVWTVLFVCSINSYNFFYAEVLIHLNVLTEHSHILEQTKGDIQTHPLHTANPITTSPATALATPATKAPPTHSTTRATTPPTATPQRHRTRETATDRPATRAQTQVINHSTVTLPLILTLVTTMRQDTAARHRDPLTMAEDTEHQPQDMVRGFN